MEDGVSPEFVEVFFFRERGRVVAVEPVGPALVSDSDIAVRVVDARLVVAINKNKGTGRLGEAVLGA